MQNLEHLIILSFLQMILHVLKKNVKLQKTLKDGLYMKTET